MSVKTTVEKAQIEESIEAKLTKYADAIKLMSKDQRSEMWRRMDTQIKRAGTEIILPAVPDAMTEDEAIETLQRIKKENSEIFEVRENISGIPWDAAVATYKAMQEIYGVVTSKTTYGFWGPNHPEFVSIDTGPNPGDVIQIPIGTLELPGSKTQYQFGINTTGAYLLGKVSKKDRERLVQIAARAKEIMREGSIYRGHAIRINALPDGKLDMTKQPEFIDLSKVKRDDIVHNAVAEQLIDTNIFSPLENTQKCRDFKIPLKRGVLLEGPYGTGKTLTALVTAKIATENGWTFIMLNRCNALGAAVNFSKLIQPVAIFTEDMDRFADRTNEQVNDLVNTLDGLDTKANEVLVVVTTNHIEKLDKALLRPGRFDAVISLLPPDKVTSQRLIKKYGDEQLEPINTPETISGMTELGELLAGQVPASIREVVKRAHLANLQRGNDSILVKDLITAASGMMRHFELLSEKKGLPTKAEVLHETMNTMVRDATGAEVKDLYERSVKQNQFLKALGAKVGVDTSVLN